MLLLSINFSFICKGQGTLMQDPYKSFDVFFDVYLNGSRVVLMWCHCNGDSLQWHHNDPDDVSNHQPHGCLLNRLFRRRSKKTSKLRVTGLCAGNSPGPVNSPHKGPVTRKMLPFDDVIMSKLAHMMAILHGYCHNFTAFGKHQTCPPCSMWYTVYPKKYAHGFVVLCFVVVMQSFIMNSHEVFIHIHQGCFAGTGAIVRLPQCQWSKPDGYGKISQCITTTKHSEAKTVCIFLGIYCTFHPVITFSLWSQQPAWHSLVGIKLLKFYNTGIYTSNM